MEIRSLPSFFPPFFSRLARAFSKLPFVREHSRRGRGRLPPPLRNPPHPSSLFFFFSLRGGEDDMKKITVAKGQGIPADVMPLLFPPPFFSFLFFFRTVSKRLLVPHFFPLLFFLFLPSFLSLRYQLPRR